MTLIPPPDADVTKEWIGKLEQSLSILKNLSTREADEVEWAKLAEILEDASIEISDYGSGIEAVDDEDDDDDEEDDDDLGDDEEDDNDKDTEKV